MIPKVIHYCWLSNDPIPDDLQYYMSSWKKIIPDYEFIKWDFSRFDKTSSAWVSEAFDHKKYAFAADYIRLYAVYNHGGIYLDMDIEVVKRFDDLLNAQYMLAYENEGETGIEAGCIGAEKYNSYIGECLKYYDGRHFVKEDGSFDTRTLPKIMKEVLEKGKYGYSLFDHNYFTAKSYETGVVKITKETYCVHNFAGSWLDEEAKLRVKLRTTFCRYMPQKLATRTAKFLASWNIRGFHAAISEMAIFLKKKLPK